MGATRSAQKVQSAKKRLAAKKKAVRSRQKNKRLQNKNLSPEAVARFEKRKAVVEAVQRGEAATLVARVHNVPIRNVFRWLSWVNEGGMSRLHDNDRSGRPSKVSPEVMQWLYDKITGGSPKQFHLEFALWTLSIIRIVLIDFKGIELNKSTICRLMHKMGLSPQVPLYQSYRKSSSKVKYYLRKRYPRFAEWAKANGAEIFFGDESRVRVDDHHGTTWAPIGDTPVVIDSGERFGVNMISAISARGAMFFECFDGRMDSDRFISFLTKLREDAKRPIGVVVDGGSYHVSKATREFIEGAGAQLGIKLLILPPYSPELNPDEQVWNQAKSKVRRMTILTRAALLDVVTRTLSAIKKSPAFIRSFFALPDTSYAAESF